MMYFFIPESPKFLFEHNMRDAFVNTIKKIAVINGKDPSQININFEEVRNLDRRHHTSQKEMEEEKEENTEAK